jgi:hypothetical protein
MGSSFQLQVIIKTIVSDDQGTPKLFSALLQPLSAKFREVELHLQRGRAAPSEATRQMSTKFLKPNGAYRLFVAEFETSQGRIRLRVRTFVSKVNQVFHQLQITRKFHRVWDPLKTRAKLQSRLLSQSSLTNHFTEQLV